VRALVENANKRLKNWRVLYGIYWYDRHDLDFFTNYLTTVCGLLNLEITLGGAPIRKDLSVASLKKRRAKKKAKREQAKKRQKREKEESEEAGSEVEESDEEEEFHEIEGIVDHRETADHGRMYRVRYKGCHHSKDMWLTPDLITSDAIDEYLEGLEQ
jgi:hypothetical protein